MTWMRHSPHAPHSAAGCIDDQARTGRCLHDCGFSLDKHVAPTRLKCHAELTVWHEITPLLGSLSGMPPIYILLRLLLPEIGHVFVGRYWMVLIIG